MKTISRKHLAITAGGLIVIVLTAAVFLFFASRFLSGPESRVILGLPSSSGKVDAYLITWKQELSRAEPFLENVRPGNGSIGFWFGDQVIWNNAPIWDSGGANTFAHFVPGANYILAHYLEDEETVIQRLDLNGQNPVDIFSTKKANVYGYVLEDRNLIVLYEPRNDGRTRCYISSGGREAQRLGKGDTCQFTEDASALITGDRSTKGLSLSVLDVRGDQEFMILDDEADVTAYRMDTEGKTIALIAESDGAARVSLRDRASGSILAESEETVAIMNYGFSRHGGRFYYIFENEDGDLQLATLDQNGATPLATAHTLSASFSRNGDYLIYVAGDSDGDMTLTVHPMSGGEDVKVLDDEGIQVSVQQSPERLLIKVQNSDGLTLYTARIDGTNLTEVYQEDDAYLISTMTIPGQEALYLLTRKNDGTQNLVVVPGSGQTGIVAVEEWKDIQVLNRSADGEYILFSGSEDASSSLALYALNIRERPDIIELDDDAERYANGVFRDSNTVIYTAVTGTAPDDVEVREIALNARSAKPETIYREAFLIDVQWSPLYPFSSVYWSYNQEAKSPCPGAKALTLGASSSDTLRGGSGNCYRFRAKANTQYAIVVEGTSNADLYVRLLNRDNNELGSDDDSGVGENPLLRTTIAADGVYYVMVTSNRGGTGSQFSIRVVEGPASGLAGRSITVGQRSQYQYNSSYYADVERVEFGNGYFDVFFESRGGTNLPRPHSSCVVDQKTSNVIQATTTSLTVERSDYYKGYLRFPLQNVDPDNSYYFYYVCYGAFSPVLLFSGSISLP